MIEWELGIIIVLLLWIGRKLLSHVHSVVAWRMLFRQLNHIEAHVRNVPVDLVEKEWSGWCEDADLARAGRTWRERILDDTLR